MKVSQANTKKVLMYDEHYLKAAYAASLAEWGERRAAVSKHYSMLVL